MLADYVINPYRGCQFGCLYCYSQENKNIKNDSFVNTVGVKINAPQILEKELKYKRPARILLGSTTECFQRIELKYRITEQILTILNKENIPYTILTKSAFISEYLPLISANKENKIYFTINMASEEMVKILERNSSSLQKRMKTIDKIIQYKVPLRIHIGPFLPHVSSLEEIIALLPKEIKEIDVELYHPKMGNFPPILAAIEKKLGKSRSEACAQCYKNQAAYLYFAHCLKTKIKAAGRKNKITFFYIVPDFNRFYSPDIDYTQPLTISKER